MQSRLVNMPNNSPALESYIGDAVATDRRINIRVVHLDSFHKAIEIELFRGSDERHSLLITPEMWSLMAKFFNILVAQRIGDISLSRDHLQNRAVEPSIVPGPNNVKFVECDFEVGGQLVSISREIWSMIDCMGIAGTERDNQLAENGNQIAEVAYESPDEYDANASNQTDTSSDDSYMDEDKLDKRLYLLYHKQPKNE